ncbi:MAG: ABC transporter ATP-binding protein [Gammaproteobacteria bacterium]|jgi:ABC-2 type transport system ATP-binding protein
MPEPPLLAAHQITRYYHGRKVLHGIDLELHRGEVLGFLGPNGAGKSTTMNILCGVIAPHAGRVEICGHDLAREPLAAKRHLGYLPEVPPLHVDATVDEYLDYCARLRGLDRSAAQAAVAEAKQTCDLSDVGVRLIGNLSKGYRQRVGIAQALLHDPAVVVLDEPTSGLDPNQIRMVRAMIEKLAAQHAIILSTHVLSEAQMLCNRVAILHHGRIAFNEALDTSQTLLRVAFARPPHGDWHVHLDGVEHVEALGGGRYRLRVSNHDAAADAVSRFAVEHALGLRELSRDTSPLETVFVDLTCNDPVAIT